MTGVAIAVVLAGWNGYLLVHAYGARALVAAVPVGLVLIAGVLAIKGAYRIDKRARAGGPPDLG